MHPALGSVVPKSVLLKEQRDHEIGKWFPWLVSSVFERRPRQCVPVTWREVHGHQVLTADTLTIEAEASDPRACATCTALKLLPLVAFRWNLNLAPSGWREQVQKPRRHQEQDQNKALSYRHLRGSHQELNTSTFVLRCQYFFYFFPLLLAGALRRSVGTSASVSRCTGCCVKAFTISSRSHMETTCGSWCGREPTSGCTPSSLTRYGGLVMSCCVAYRHCLAIKTLFPYSKSKNVYPLLCVSRCTARVWYPVLPRQPAEWQGPPTMSWWTLGASTSWDLLENTAMTEFSRWKEEKLWVKLLTLCMCLPFCFFFVVVFYCFGSFYLSLDILLVLPFQFKF